MGGRAPPLKWRFLTVSSQFPGKGYNACTKHFPARLCTTKLAQSTFQYYFVLQSLHKVLPSTTLYYVCTSTSQYYFVLQNLHKSTSQYYFVLQLLCTTKLAQSTPQYYFALQSLHKVLPSTTLYCKACTKSFPVLLCTTKPAEVRPGLLCATNLAQSLHQDYFVLQCLHKESFYTQQILSQRSFHTQQAVYTQKLLHTTSFYTEKLLHTASVYTQNTFAQSAFTHGKRLHRQKLLHREAFTHREAFYTQQAFTHTIFYIQQAFTEKKIHREAFLYVMTIGFAAPKPDGSRHQSKIHDFEELFKRNFTRKITSAKIETSADRSLSQP